MKRVILIGLVLLGVGCGPVSVKTYPTEARLKETKAVEFQPVGSKYLKREREVVDELAFHLYRPTKDSRVAFTTSRPERDGKIAATFAGTYTSPIGKPEGYVYVDGKAVRNDERQGWNGAVSIAADGTVEILKTESGKILTKDWLRSQIEGRRSLFQAHLLVINGQAQDFKVQPKYQRRALAIFPDGPVIVESEDLLELNRFAQALVKLGALKAVNLDMGGWSEGWYRNNQGEIISIGYLQTDTEKQSNWLEIVGR